MSKFDCTVLTLFPEMFPGPLGFSLIGQALKDGVWSLNVIDIRDFGIGKHAKVDDTPYGGGAGMVLKPDVLDATITAAFAAQPNSRLIYLSPRGQSFDQPMARELVTAPAIFLCGRFEGIDERIIDKYKPLEVSIGDFVMTGGELAAMAMMDSCVRLIDGVIGESESLAEESFGLSKDYACLLEHPHYTKPPVWEGMQVPDVLLSGDHAKINRWRFEQAQQVTKARRPDLWERFLAKKG